MVLKVRGFFRPLGLVVVSPMTEIWLSDSSCVSAVGSQSLDASMGRLGVVVVCGV